MHLPKSQPISVARIIKPCGFPLLRFDGSFLSTIGAPEPSPQQHAEGNEHTVTAQKTQGTAVF